MDPLIRGRRKIILKKLASNGQSMALFSRKPSVREVMALSLGIPGLR